MAKTKYNWLVGKKKWGAKSPDDEKIVAMAAEIKLLKGRLKLNPKLAEIADKKDEDKKGGKKTRNKKDTSNKREQKKDKAWKKIPPKEETRTLHLPLVQTSHGMDRPQAC